MYSARQFLLHQSSIQRKPMLARIITMTVIRFSFSFVMLQVFIHGVAGKSFKDAGGHIFDCVNIYKQPALNHPALKNHKIQMRPSSYQNKRIQGKAPTSNNVEQPDRKHAACPEGTVPILRTSKKLLEHLRAPMFRKSDNSSTETIVPGNRHEYAILEVGRRDKQYLGVYGGVGSFNPKVEPGQFSKAAIWLQNEYDGPAINFIQFGFMVDPILYSDNYTHFFTLWTADNNHKTGCYNLRCPGFVQVHPSFGPGSIVPNVSQVGGSVYYYRFLAHKDPETGNWWVQMGELFENLGYFPQSLFTGLSKVATNVGWGGEISTTANQSGYPEMGSGYHSTEGLEKSAFVLNYEVMDGSYDRSPPPEDDLQIISTCPDCYDAKLFTQDDIPFFLYGGPGGNCD